MPELALVTLRARGVEIEIAIFRLRIEVDRLQLMLVV
jgi:hypothetical protein